MGRLWNNRILPSRTRRIRKSFAVSVAIYALLPLTLQATVLPPSGDAPPHFVLQGDELARPLRRLPETGRVVAVLVDFPDRPANRADRPAAFYHELLFSLGTIPTGSLREFYLEQSYGQYDISGDSYGWFRTFENYYDTFDDGNYGGAGGSRGAAIAAILLADPTVDFGLYDSDGPDGVPNSGDDDGCVDALFVISSQLSGVDTGDPSDFWPAIGAITPEYQTDDPAAGGGFICIDTFSIQPEVNLDHPLAEADTLETSLAVLAHEYGHLIGLPDLYDGSRTTWGIGYWGLMGYGSYGWNRTGPYQLSAWCKSQLGWLTPIEISESTTNLLLPPVETDPVAYKVWRNGNAGDEYFLLENRQQILHDSSLPGSGLLVWHVDESVFGPGKTEKRSDTFDYWLGLEQADGLNQMNTYFVRPVRTEYYPEMGDSGDPYPGDSQNTTFDEFSNPASLDVLGKPTGVRIESVQVEGDQIRLDIHIDELVPVLFSSFRARASGSGIWLEWEVAAEIVEFRLYRRGGGTEPSELFHGRETEYFDADAIAGVAYEYVLAAVMPDLSESRSSPLAAMLTPSATLLHQNTPNPFNPSTSISFYLDKSARARLSVYTLDGTLVRTLADATFAAGLKRFHWDGRDRRGAQVGSGTYLYRLETGNRILTKKMVMLK